MAVEFRSGDLFAAQIDGRPVDALVNPVNCIGRMGRGLALDFKERYPQIMTEYRLVCDTRKLLPGRPHIISASGPTPAIVLFPTKNHWRNPSNIEWIRDGLAELVRLLEQNDLTSVAIPALGCGLGGLAWADVSPLIVAAFENSIVNAVVYPPVGALEVASA